MNSSFRQTIIKKIKENIGYQKIIDSLAYDKFPLHVEGLSESLLSFILSEISLINKGRILAVFPTQKEASQFYEDLKSFSFEPIYIPPRQRVIYQLSSESKQNQFQELSALTKLLAPPTSDKNTIVITVLQNLLQPVFPAHILKQQNITLTLNSIIDPIALAEQLVALKYERVPRVSLPGEFSLKGEVLDIFLPGNQYPHRIVYQWDEITKITEVDFISSISFSELDYITIFPAKEYLWDTDCIKNLEDYIKERPILLSQIKQIISPLLENLPISNEQLFFYCSSNPISFLFDYFDKDEDIILFSGIERLTTLADALKKEAIELYGNCRSQKIPAPHPDDILISFEQALNCFKKRINLYEIRESASSKTRISIDSDQPISFFGNIAFMKQEIENYLQHNYDVYIFADSDIQQKRISQIFKEFTPTIIEQSLWSGFFLHQQKLMIVSEKELFGQKQRIPSSVKKSRTRVIDSFVELEPGDYVVHVNYGIGLFKSIKRIKAASNERDYIEIAYADEETIFVPVEQVNLIQKYIGNEGNAPNLDRIGSKAWSARKVAAHKSVEELAEKLLDIYARRKEAKGYAFSKDTQWQIEFEAQFPYEETQDQLQCIQEIKADMESSKPMDRLVCGDVGYGKTEVALRAAFKAIIDGRQVAFLAPTTILVEQHFETAQKRFKNFPIKIEMISRFVSPKKIKQILEELKRGDIDLLIGTHRLLSKDVEFKNLALLIIDEEQRFGVKDKERLKDLKASIDCLALSATPIPRTLHFSLLKIRDMSLLTTPPYNRKPIQTIIGEFNDDLIATAIKNEMDRGGQVFFLHNRIESLESMRQYIQKIVPSALVCLAHGRMSANELEELMHRFVQGDYHILLATTIIENGIDIPNVNTIIIDRAHTYGIGQLYQLRGRVGRSSKEGYAYLFYPPKYALSEIAMKRLQIISDNSDLGAGFKVAMKDLEVRGAGNLLGKQQSGQIASVGYELYLKMLEETIAKLQGKEDEFEWDIVMELVYSGFIPDDYVSDPSDKMVCYKKIAGIQNELELDSVVGELTDRFGPLPIEVQSLLSLAEIRIICKKLSISVLKERGGIVEIHFEKIHKINANKVVRMLSQSNGVVTYRPDKPQVLFLKTNQIQLSQKSEFIRHYLTQLL